MTTIKRLNGDRVNGRYARHLRTMTGESGSANIDLDLWRLDDGAEIVCETHPAYAVETPYTAEQAAFLETYQPMGLQVAGADIGGHDDSNYDD